MSRLIATMLFATMLTGCQMQGKGYSGSTMTSGNSGSSAGATQARPGDPPPEMKASQSE